MMESCSSPPYVSAPCSPIDCSSCEFAYYYSAPSSPIRGLSGVPFDWELEPGLPKRVLDHDSDSDDFEFETSRRFCRLSDHGEPNGEQRNMVDDFPTMSSADELFRDGRILPLRLPPRLQHVDAPKLNIQSCSSCCSRTLATVFPRPFSGRNKEFDPFDVALERVKREAREREDGRVPYKRARSLSPLRGPCWGGGPTKEIMHKGQAVGPNRHLGQGIGRVGPVGPAEFEERPSDKGDGPMIEARCPTDTTGPMRGRGLYGPEGSRYPNTTGSISARYPNTTAPIGVPTPTVSVGPITHTKFRSFSLKGSKRWKIVNLVFRSASEGTAGSNDGLKDYTISMRKSRDENFRSEEMKKKNFMPLAHGLLSCVGFHGKHANTMMPKEPTLVS
ncbi:hypothetical protein AMTRI_Chr01g127480 [Amborella trichopoda]